MDQIRTLSHNLNSSWTTINHVTYFLSKEHLSPSDRQLYEAMLGRAKANLQSTLDQLFMLLPQRNFFSDVVRLINQIEAQNLTVVLIELKPLISKVRTSIEEASNSIG